MSDRVATTAPTPFRLDIGDIICFASSNVRMTDPVFFPALEQQVKYLLDAFPDFSVFLVCRLFLFPQPHRFCKGAFCMDVVMLSNGFRMPATLDIEQGNDVPLQKEAFQQFGLAWKVNRKLAPPYRDRVFTLSLMSGPATVDLLEAFVDNDTLRTANRHGGVSPSLPKEVFAIVRVTNDCRINTEDAYIVDDFLNSGFNSFLFPADHFMVATDNVLYRTTGTVVRGHRLTGVNNPKLRQVASVARRPRDREEYEKLLKENQKVGLQKDELIRSQRAEIEEKNRQLRANEAEISGLKQQTGGARGCDSNRRKSDPPGRPSLQTPLQASSTQTTPTYKDVASRPSGSTGDDESEDDSRCMYRGGPLGPATGNRHASNSQSQQSGALLAGLATLKPTSSSPSNISSPSHQPVDNSFGGNDDNEDSFPLSSGDGEITEPDNLEQPNQSSVRDEAVPNNGHENTREDMLSTRRETPISDGMNGEGGGMVAPGTIAASSAPAGDPPPTPPEARMGEALVAAPTGGLGCAAARTPVRDGAPEGDPPTTPDGVATRSQKRKKKKFGWSRLPKHQLRESEVILPVAPRTGDGTCVPDALVSILSDRGEKPDEEKFREELCPNGQWAKYGDIHSFLEKWGFAADTLSADHQASKLRLLRRDKGHFLVLLIDHQDKDEEIRWGHAIAFLAEKGTLCDNTPYCQPVTLKPADRAILNDLENEAEGKKIAKAIFDDFVGTRNAIQRILSIRRQDEEMERHSLEHKRKCSLEKQLAQKANAKPKAEKIAAGRKRRRANYKRNLKLRKLEAWRAGNVNEWETAPLADRSNVNEED